ncbi:site-specific integrase [Paenibacillus larvae subsp. pulvifaciens]|uniref:Site-specific integrase n=1 Tax=Paenibacillus larvae subsp. pulvifaciens TaxID=1477 RepID=A0A1V0UUW2_9BACL|nr:site-specific integrase [Paenibacillus larvae]ARF68916.1 site-specific integrase [Paenibacillus larvae subsp. pulvifaciens]
MKGSFRRRGCTCKKKRCTCGSKWTYRYSIIDPTTGKRKQKETPGFTTKAEAEQEALRIQGELQQGTYIEEKNTTFQEFALEWLSGYEKSGRVKQSTIDIRKSKLRYLTKHFGGIKIKDISKLMYQRFLDELAQNLARKTVSSVHEVGSLIFKKAVELEIISKDITEHVEIPKKIETVEDLENQEELPRYLEKEELKQFLKSAKESINPLDFPIFLILAYTGLRIGELCALKWRDVNFEEQTLSITKTIYNRRNKSGDYLLHTPKTKSSKRVIDVDDLVLDVLKQYRRSQKIVNLDDRENHFIFIDDKKNAPLTTYYIYRRMQKLLKKSGIKHRISPHSLRHTHTSLLAEAGVSLEVIQHRLGHQNDRITRSIYLHVTKPKRKEASQKFAKLMGGI